MKSWNKNGLRETGNQDLQKFYLCNCKSIEIKMRGLGPKFYFHLVIFIKILTKIFNF